MDARKSSIQAGVESVMLSTFQNHHPGLNKPTHQSPFASRKKSTHIGETKLEKKKRALANIETDPQGPYLGLADCKSSSPYKKHFMYGSMSAIREGKPLNMKNSQSRVLLSNVTSEERMFDFGSNFSGKLTKLTLV